MRGSHAEHKQYVGEDTSNQGRLHNRELTLDECKDGDDQFDDVAESGVEESTEGLTETECSFFSCKAQQAG